MKDLVELERNFRDAKKLKEYGVTSAEKMLDIEKKRLAFIFD